jgi:hypothetical protein
MWIRHLALCAAVEDGALEGTSPTTWAVGRSCKPGRDVAAARIGPYGGAPDLLERVAVLWQESETCVPPFYPLASRAYVERFATELKSGTDPRVAADRARRRAAEAFGIGREVPEASPDEWNLCDLDDAELSLALGDALPWDPDGDIADKDLMARFEETARAVFEPLDAHWVEAHDGEALALASAARGGAW